MTAVYWLVRKLSPNHLLPKERFALACVKHHHQAIRIDCSAEPPTIFAADLRRGDEVLEIPPQAMESIRKRGLVDLTASEGRSFPVLAGCTHRGEEFALKIGAPNIDLLFYHQRLRTAISNKLLVAFLAALGLAAIWLIVSLWPSMHVVDSWTWVLAQLAFVLAVGTIDVPARWADSFPLAFIGGIPAWSRVGLGIWALYSIVACVLLSSQPYEQGLLTEAMRFMVNHPVLALALGPLLSVYLATSPD